MNFISNSYPEYTKKQLLESIFSIENDFSIKERNEIIRKFYKALNFAEDKHKEQFRDSGEAYIEHLKRTLHNIFSLLNSCVPREYIGDLIVAAILHDVIEDTKITKEELEEKFGTNVAKIVEYISKDNVDLYNGDRIERNKVYHEKLHDLNNFKGLDGETIILRHLAIIIKAADRIDNLTTMWSWSIKKMIIKIKETVDNILPIYHKIHNKKIINELDIAIKIAENHVELKSNNNCEECEKDCDTKKIM